MVTEVYSCRPGQKLKEGRLDYSHDIHSREQAEADAKRRVQLDPGLAKLAYYKVSEDGRFRVLYSFTNPKPLVSPPSRRQGAGLSRPLARPVQRPVQPVGLFDRLLGLLKLKN